MPIILTTNIFWRQRFPTPASGKSQGSRLVLLVVCALVVFSGCGKKAAPPSKRELAQRAYQEGLALWDGRGFIEPEKAVALFSRALELKPGQASAYTQRGIAHAGQGRPRKAMEDFNHAIKLDPKDPAPYAQRGLIHNSMGRFGRAIQEFSFSLTRDTHQPSVYAQRGFAQASLGRLEVAVSDYTKAILMGLQTAQVYNHLGLAQAGLGQEREALESYGVANQIDPFYIPAYFNHAALSFKRKDFQETVRELTRALELDPRHASALRMRGDSYLSLGKKAEACIDLVKSCQIEASLLCPALEHICQ